MKKLKSFSLLLKILCVFSLFMPLKVHAAPALFWILFGGIGGGFCCAITSVKAQTWKKEYLAPKPLLSKQIQATEEDSLLKAHPTNKGPRLSIQADDTSR